MFIYAVRKQSMNAAGLALFFLTTLPMQTAGSSPAAHAAHALKDELLRYRDDAKSLATAPLHWDRQAWERFGEGAAVVAALYATDHSSSDAVQENRTSFSRQFAKQVTPFGGGRAMQLTILMIGTGLLTHDTNLRDAGRDALESELWAAGVVTPLLKRTFGRARPSQGEGSHSFTPLDGHFESFPSGHATNAFALATAVAGHYDGWGIPTLMYSLATGVAISRVHDRAHFPSDVVAGAMIGRAVARSIVIRHGGNASRHSLQVLPVVAPGATGLMVRWTGN